MARRRPKSQPNPEIDMTPMIDVVFQLITFFMFTINFEETQADERVKLPRDSLAKPPEVKVMHTIVMNIGYLRDLQGDKTDPQPWLFQFGNDASGRIRPLDAGPIMAQEARLYQLRKVDPKEVTIRIRADEDLPTGLVQEVIKLCQDKGFEKFSIAASSEERS